GCALRPLGAGAAKGPCRVGLASRQFEIVRIGLVCLQEHAQPPGPINDSDGDAVAVRLALIERGNGDCQAHAHADVAMCDNLRARQRWRYRARDDAGSKSKSNAHERISLGWGRLAAAPPAFCPSPIAGLSHAL